MENLNQMEYFHALMLKDLKKECSDLGDQILNHLVYCYLFSDQKTVSRWVNESLNWIIRLSDKKIKGGTFKYDYIWNDYTPFSDRQLDARVRNALSKESKFIPLRISTNWLRNYLNNIVNNINKRSVNSKRVLNRAELELIIYEELHKLD